eukprot:g5174.t1
MSLLLDRIRARRPKGYDVCSRRRTARDVPDAVHEARETAKAYKETRRRRLKQARYRAKQISHRPLSAVTQRPSGLPSFRLGLLLANAKDYDGYSLDTALCRDDEHARILFQQAADIGHAGAQVALGEFHQAGRGRKRGGVPPMIAGVTSRQSGKDKMDAPRLRDAKKYFRSAAKAGDPHACLRLAICIEDSDMWRARELYRKAAKAGLLDAMYNLGMLCMRITPPDYNESLAMLLRAAEQNHSGAIVNLGVMYLNGRGVQKDEGRAKEYFHRAASLGDPFGMSNLGCMHAHECALAEKSLEWCREEVANKFGIDWEMQLEQNQISSHAFELSGPSAESPFETPAARKPGWLKQALREAEAALQMSMQRAKQKDKLAAVQDHLRSLETSASHHQAEAIRWFKKASDAGHIDSKMNLGIMLGETGDSEGTIDIMQQSLSLTSAPVLAEATPSISIANIKPSVAM